MPSNEFSINLPSAGSLLSTQEERDDAIREKVVNLDISQLHDFQGHPFQVRMDEDMFKLVDSIKAYGVLSPALVRPRVEGGYEIIAGHRRRRGCELAGVQTIPCLVRDFTDDEATIVMVDTNLQREQILPSERAFAYKMKLEAMKRQAGRPRENNSAPVEPNLKGTRSNDILAESVGESTAQIKRYIRLTYLTKSILDMVDEGKIAFRPAVELSFLTSEQQDALCNEIAKQDCTPSLAQAIKMKQFSQEGRLGGDVIYAILCEEKPNQKEALRIPVETLQRYIPKSVPLEKTQDYILKALEHYQKALERRKQQER